MLGGFDLPSPETVCDLKEEGRKTLSRIYDKVPRSHKLLWTVAAEETRVQSINLSENYWGGPCLNIRVKFQCDNTWRAVTRWLDPHAFPSSHVLLRAGFDSSVTRCHNKPSEAGQRGNDVCLRKFGRAHKGWTLLKHQTGRSGRGGQVASADFGYRTTSGFSIFSPKTFRDTTGGTQPRKIF